MQSVTSRLFNRAATATASAMSAMSAVSTSTIPPWLQWRPMDDESGVAASLRTRGVSSVVLNSSSCKEVGSEIGQGEPLCVVEWAEIHPFLHVSRKETVVAPVSGIVRKNSRCEDPDDIGMCVVADKKKW